MAVRKRVKRIIRRSSNSSKNHHNISNDAKQTVKINIGGVNPGQPGSRPFQGGSTSIVMPGPPPQPQTPWTIVERNFVENNPFKSIPKAQQAVNELGQPIAPIAIGANGPEPIVNKVGGSVEQPRTSNDAVNERPHSFYENAIGNTIGPAPAIQPISDASGTHRLIDSKMGPVGPEKEAKIENEEKSATASSSSSSGGGSGVSPEIHLRNEAENMTIDELKKALSSRGVKYRSNNTKATLINKYVSSSL